MIRIFKDTVRAIPGVTSLYNRIKFSSSPFVQFFPPGHFYSPIPDLTEVLAREKVIFDTLEREILSIDLRPQAQLELLKTFSSFYPELPFPEEAIPSHRYYLNTEYFPYTDGIVLYSMMRQFCPKRIVEVGSGFSSAAMLDVNDLFLDGTTKFTFIEPNPERLYSLLSQSDQQQHEIIEQPVQEVDFKCFEALEAGDFLFIDSSHVVKVGSDVAHLIFEILPRLKQGVIIHFHDIFCSFEYPKEWIKVGRAWNEAYCLRAFLQFNTAFQILFFNSFIGQVYPTQLAQYLPLGMKQTGASLWLQKTT